MDRINKVFPNHKLAMPQGRTSIKKKARADPTGLALSAFPRSPLTIKAKLVVIPQEGHGLPVRIMKLQGGNPSCSCVPICRALPSDPYGLSQKAMPKIAVMPKTKPIRALRNQVSKGLPGNCLPLGRSESLPWVVLITMCLPMCNSR